MIRNKNNERIDRRVGSPDRDQKDLTFADILNIDTHIAEFQKMCKETLSRLSFVHIGFNMCGGTGNKERK
mgnify:FL=1